MRNGPVNVRRLPRCPYCGSPVDTDRTRIRDVSSFPCPACGEFLQVEVPPLWVFVLAWLACSGFVAWATGLRGLTLVLVALILFPVVLFVGGATILPFRPASVRCYKASTKDPKSHHLSLGLSSRRTADEDRPMSEVRKAEKK
jgi:hypothetical protein